LKSVDLATHPTLVFNLGEPITIDFNASRETLKRRDWIGILSVTSNLSREVTVSKTPTWMYITGTQKALDDDDATPMMTKIPNPPGTRATLKGPKMYMLGQTKVMIKQSEEDKGLRIVSGTLKFRRTRLPWKVGSYEARYHLDNAFSVLAISQPFEIAIAHFDWSLHKEKEDTVRDIEKRLLEYVQRCVDIDEETSPPLDPNEDIWSRCQPDEDIIDAGQLTLDTEIPKIPMLLANVWRCFSYSLAGFAKYKEDVAGRIVYGIRQIFDVEFSWKAVNVLRTVRVLANRVSSIARLFSTGLS
jgi:hypothetical protein